MIVFFVGTPGSGKSYEAVKKIIDNLKLGRTVCTNIDGMDLPESQEYIKSLLDMDDFTFRQRFRFLGKDQIRCFWKTEKIINLKFMQDADSEIWDDVAVETNELICPRGSLIVIDEVHKHFNARDWNIKDANGVNANRDLGDWASTHRHLGYDLVLITQDIDKVDKQVRTLTEWCYFFRKVNFFGSAIQKKYLCYSYSGDDHNGKPLAKNVRNYESKYFPAYQSYSASDAKEVGFMSHTNILKHPVFYAIPAVLCLCLYMFFYKSSFASGDLFGVSKVQHKYDNPVVQNIKTPAVKPVMNNISGHQKQLQPVPVAADLSVAPVAAALLPPSVLPAYAQYKVDGYILDNGKTIVQINGSVVRLPSPHVQKFYKESGMALAETDYFGPPKNHVYSSAAVQRPADLSPSPGHDKHAGLSSDFTGIEPYKAIPPGTDFKTEFIKK